MKEYWVNVYEGVESRFLYQCARCLSREYASQLSGENKFGYCGQTLYRIHVKMKEPLQPPLRDNYPFSFDQLIYSEARGRYDTYDYFKVKGIKRTYALPTSKYWMD